MPFFGIQIYKVKTRTVYTRLNETADQEPPGKKNWWREHLIEKNQFHSAWQIIWTQTVNQEMRTTCLMPHFPILALNLTIRLVTISHLLMKPNSHVSYSRATEDELRTSSCFHAKGRLYNAGRFLATRQTGTRKLRHELQENNWNLKHWKNGGIKTYLQAWEIIVSNSKRGNRLIVTEPNKQPNQKLTKIKVGECGPWSHFNVTFSADR